MNSKTCVGRLQGAVLMMVIFLVSSVSLFAGDVRVRVFSKYELKDVTIESAAGKGSKCFLRLNGAVIETIYNAGKASKKASVWIFNGEYGNHTVIACGQTRVIPGKLEAYTLPDEKGIVLVSTMDIEDYVPCVLSSELGAALYKPELAKAFAVTIRSFAVYNNKRHGTYDFCDLTHCEVFKGVPLQRTMWYGPVKATKGMILYGDCAKKSVYFSACCGGLTENAGEFLEGKAGPCGQSKADRLDGKNLCESHRYFRWTKIIKKDDMENALAVFLDNQNREIKDIRIAEKTGSGRVKVMDFTYDSGGVEKHIRLDANKYLSVFGKQAGWASIPSKAFEIKKEGNVFILNGRGHGHGVGLCVQGALTLAGMGKGYQEILKFYFQKLNLMSNNAIIH